MRNRTEYEWVLEEVDEYGDIGAVDHFATYKEALKASLRTPPDGCHFEIGLVRDVGNDYEGVLDRQWAYIEKDKLPAEFDGGAKVPKKYLHEVA